MRVGIILLCFAYVISQFFRSFLAVLSEQLHLDLGATSDDLALSMGFWFLTFSLMQIPVGTALDKILSSAVPTGICIKEKVKNQNPIERARSSDVAPRSRCNCSLSTAKKLRKNWLIT